MDKSDRMSKEEGGKGSKVDSKTTDGDKGEFKVPSLPTFNFTTTTDSHKKDSDREPNQERTLLSPYIPNRNLNLSVREKDKDKEEDSKLVFPLPNGPQVAARSQSSTRSKKVALEPGHSPLDWTRLITSGKDLRGVAGFRMVTLEELHHHNKPEDAWCAINGRVYNITPYMKFHPGGVKQLMKGAGKDATVIYNKIHPWVNADSLLGPCFIGPLEYR